jgi:hypothetical protein
MASTDIQAFWQHPFDQDPEYNVCPCPCWQLRHAVLTRSKEGVSSIVQSGMLAGKSPAEVEQLMLQSQLFFWNRCVARLTSGEGTPDSLAGSISWA